MNKGDSDQLFDYYESRIITGNVPIRYYFRIEAGEEICFYNRLGPADQENRDFDFVITPGISHAGLGQGRGDVPDFCRPLLQRRPFQRCGG